MARRKPDRAGDIRRARFETVRRFLESAFLERDADDHFAAAVPRRHRFQNFGATVERADAGRATHLVSGESEKIATHFLHIERQMSRRSAPHRPGQRADRARLPAKIGHGIDRAERIGDMRESEEFHFRGEQLRELIERERAILAHRHETQPRAGSLRQELPGHEIAVVLHFREQDHVTGAEEIFRPTPARRD